MKVDYQSESQMNKKYQWNLKADKKVSSINIYQITEILDYNMFGEISKQQNTYCTQPYYRRKQQVINKQESSIYFWNTTLK